MAVIGPAPGRRVKLDCVRQPPAKGGSSCMAAAKACIGSLPISASFTGPQVIRWIGQGPSRSSASAWTGAR